MCVVVTAKTAINIESQQLSLSLGSAKKPSTNARKHKNNNNEIKKCLGTYFKNRLAAFGRE